MTGNWTLQLASAFSCLGAQQAVNVPNFSETVVLEPPESLHGPRDHWSSFHQGRTVTLSVSGTEPLTYIGTFPFVLGNSAASAVEITFYFRFEVRNNRLLEGTLSNVTVKQNGLTVICENGDYRATLTKQ